MNFILDKDYSGVSRFWLDFKGQEYYGTDKKISKLKEMDKINCRVAKIKKIQNAIYKI